MRRQPFIPPGFLRLPGTDVKLAALTRQAETPLESFRILMRRKTPPRENLARMC